ncbi:MAG: hypothetical protein AMS16_06635 [Planctomycetes bacterium DG_58]|nr:MAG: hypothetical protein AMS16_06635 [Planctomycetes bacterium DG_58]
MLLRSYQVRRERESGVEGKIWTYRMTAPKPVDEATPAKEKEEEATPAPEKPSVEEVEKIFLESDVAAPLNEHMYDLFERVAVAKYENSGDATAPVEYLTTLLKTRPHNGMHLHQLASIMKPYASMAGKYDDFLSLLAEVKAAYKGSKEVMAAVTEQQEAAQNEKAEAARAGKYFDTVKNAEHDPLDDWPSERPASGAQNRGAGVAPPFQTGWTQKIPRVTPFDRVVPTDRAVFVFQSRTGTLVSLDPADGRKLWELGRLRNFVYYRGIAYVLGEELRAITPREGLVLWKRGVEADELGRDAAMAAGEQLIFLATRRGIQAYDWATGREKFRLDLPGKDRIDVHGSTLIAVTTNTGKLHALEAKTGRRRWTGQVGTYSLFDGKLYSFAFERDSKKIELILIGYEAATGRELWRRHYDLPPGRRTPPLVPPAVSWENILVVCDVNLLHLARANGEIVAKHTLPAYVTVPLAAGPNLLYVNTVDRKLTAYDLTNNLSQVWELPTTGKGAMAIGHGTLYILDKNELKAFRGEKQDYSAEHLKALAQPAEDAGGAGDEPKDTKIAESRFVTVGMIRDMKELPAKMDDKRLSTIAFQQLVHLGDVSDWKLMIDEMTKRLAPGERKTRPLTAVETRMLFAELIQRREATGQRLVKDMLESGNRRLTQMVLELMTTGDRSVYGPLLLRVFRESLEKEKYMVATFCAEAVGNWRHEPGISLLTNALGNTGASEGLRFEAAKALALFDSSTATAALVRAARERTRSSLPEQCARLLVNQGPNGIKAVGDLLGSASAEESVRLNAAQALADARTPEATSALLSALKAEGGSYPAKVRAQAAASLGLVSKENEDVFKALVANMKDRKNDPYLRNACMNGLGMSDNPKAIPYLIEMMGDRDVDNRKFTKTSAYQLLRRLTRERRIGQYKDEWLRWWEKNKDRFEKKP